jgi:hypothetical protein
LPLYVAEFSFRSNNRENKNIFWWCDHGLQMAQRIVAVALCCKLLIVCDTFAQSLRSLVKDQNENAENPTREAKPDLRATKDPTFVIETVPSQGTQTKSAADQEQEKQKAFAEKVIAYSTLALAIFTFCLAGFDLTP